MMWALLAFFYLSTAVMVFAGIMQLSRKRDLWTGLLAAGIGLTWPLWLTLVACGCG